ncbi:hypothetical protein F53441_7231 [Fusarium austroafricanum]|uniref:Amidohydrolase-related domain-containing protein n=1 Tax=Fusarium austroafricanum TaxID=2364996 RepID=A0A8H4KG53_9HYPO|nr:hypothetical protein F53441_7231 [Fusarium austroafricanum]
MGSQTALPIIDSHIHLYPASEVDSLAWYSNDHPLAGQHSVDEYRQATKPETSLEGYIFIETDRKNDLKTGERDGSGWKEPLAELSWIKRVALGQPRPHEGHRPQDSKLCLGMVLWAPMPSNIRAMEKYILKVQEEAGLARSKVKGFRYLLQDKPDGTMLESDFIANAKMLGRHGFTFDLCIDSNRRGQSQLDDVIELTRLVSEGVPENERIVLVLDHLGKPNLSDQNAMTDAAFIAWRTSMQILGQYSHVYVKLSGGFAEMGDCVDSLSFGDLCKRLQKWFKVILEAFGSDRIMFASDWPVCTIDASDAWVRWRDLVLELCRISGLTMEEQKLIFADTARKAYKL